jgi:hypothetical protein
MLEANRRPPRRHKIVGRQEMPGFGFAPSFEEPLFLWSSYRKASLLTPQAIALFKICSVFC